MLYGHVETIEDRVEHLGILRSLQDETGGFLAYIPLAYHPDHNELGKELGREGTATTGFDDLRNLAWAGALLIAVAVLSVNIIARTLARENRQS